MYSIERESVVEFIIQNNLLPGIAGYMNVNEYPAELSTAAGHLIAAITDECQLVITKVRQMNDFVTLLTQIAHMDCLETSNCMPILPVLCGGMLLFIIICS